MSESMESWSGSALSVVPFTRTWLRLFSIPDPSAKGKAVHQPNPSARRFPDSEVVFHKGHDRRN